MEQHYIRITHCKYTIRVSNAPTLCYFCCWYSRFCGVGTTIDNCVEIDNTTKYLTHNINKNINKNLHKLTPYLNIHTIKKRLIKKSTSIRVTNIRKGFKRTNIYMQCEPQKKHFCHTILRHTSKWSYTLCFW